MVGPLLAKAVGQPTHSLAEVANRAVHPFDVAGANLLFVHGAVHRGLDRPYYPGRRVTALILPGRQSVHLVHHAVVNPVAKLLFDFGRVRSPAVAADVEVAERRGVQFGDELLGVLLGCGGPCAK